MTEQVGTEDFVLQKSVSSTKVVAALKSVLEDTYGRADLESLREDIASELDLETEELPANISVEITVKFGKLSASISGTESNDEESLF